MAEELTKLQESTITHVVKNLYRTEKIVNYDLDQSKWTIKHLYKDTIWVQLLDEPDADTLIRNGLLIPVNQVRGLYRLGKVILCGEETRYAKVGEIVRFPQGVGQPYEQKVGGYKTFLLREDSVMAVVEFQGTEDEMDEHITNDIHLQGK